MHIPVLQFLVVHFQCCQKLRPVKQKLCSVYICLSVCLCVVNLLLLSQYCVYLTVCLCVCLSVCVCLLCQYEVSFGDAVFACYILLSVSLSVSVCMSLCLCVSVCSYLQLLSQYEAVSFADAVFACYILLPLQQRHSIVLRTSVWAEHSAVLHCLTVPLNQVTCQLLNHLHTSLAT